MALYRYVAFWIWKRPPVTGQVFLRAIDADSYEEAMKIVRRMKREGKPGTNLGLVAVCCRTDARNLADRILNALLVKKGATCKRSRATRTRRTSTRT